jgi:hypothetical protein
VADVDIDTPGVSDATVKFNVAVESQPCELVVVKVYVPAAVLLPFQLYGNALEQMLTLLVDVVFVFTVKFNVAVESQPCELVVVKVYVPATVLLPFQLYGNALGQMLTLVVDVSGEQKTNPAIVLTNPFAVTLTLPLAPIETTAVIVESF